MAVYIITVFILFIFSVHEIVSNNTKKKNTFLFITYILLVFVIGFRWETGTDWDTYLNTFDNATNFRELISSIFDMEKGYLLLNFVIRSVTSSYSIFLVVHALIMYYLIIKSLKKLTDFPQLTILLFFSTTLGTMGSNRQLIAVSLCLFALTFLINKKKYSYAGIVLSSFLFHTSALLFGVYYFINRKIKTLYLYLAVLIAFIIGKSNIPYYIFSFFGNVNQFAAEKTESYLSSASETIQYAELSITGLIKRLLFLFIFIILRDKISDKLKHYNVLLNGYVMGVVFYFLFANTLLVMVSRGSIYFLVMEPLLLTSILYVLHRNIDKIAYAFGLFLLSIVFIYQSISVYPDLFNPYKGVFINTLFYRSMY